MGVVMKKSLAVVSMFAIVMLGMFTGLRLLVVADNPTVYATQFTISIVDGTTAPQNYGVEWSLQTSDGQSLNGNGYATGGNVGTFTINDGETNNSHVITADDILFIRVQSAGLSIILGGEDVTDTYGNGVSVKLGELASSYDFTLQSNAGNDGNGGNDGENGEGGGNDVSSFNGNVWFVWAGANDAFCVHQLTGLNTFNEDGHPEMNYRTAGSITDIHTGEQLTIPNKNHFWLYDSAADVIFTDENRTEKAFSTYSEFEAFVNQDEDILRSLAYDPCGAVDGEASICTNGDRIFRVTIYNETNYQGMQFSINPEDYTYFPDWWDPVFFSNEVDLSNTSRSNPAQYESFLLEPKAHFGATETSISSIQNIEALDVPDNAVSVTNNGNGSFDVVFNSNFYVAVEFKVTTEKGVYYVTIQRTCFKAHDNKKPNQSDADIIAQFYYAASETYSSYDVVATKYYSDGTTKVEILEPQNKDEDGGTNLRCTTYATSLDANLVGVAYMAVKAGTLDGTSFNGVQAGANTGYYYDVAKRTIVY